MKMATSTNSSRFKYLLECKHTGYATIAELSFRVACPVCHVPRKLVAIECREWHAKCDDCRYGQWFGQDKAAANLAISRHNNSHRVHLDYFYRKDSKDKVASIFGRRVRKYILESNHQFLSERFIELTAISIEFVCDQCKQGNHDDCGFKGCNCQHKSERIPF